MADDKLFRKAALDKLASPERLDVLMQVTPPQGPIALWTIGGLLVAAAAWGIFGSVPERIPGQGLLSGGNVQQIKAAGDGQLSELTLKDLDTVAVDQIVGTISGVGIEESSNAAQARYEQALRDYEMTRASEAATISDLRAERTRAELRKSEREAYYQKRLQAFKAGDISRRDVDAVKREVDSIQSEITALTDRIRGREGAIQRAATAVEQQRIDLQKEQATTQDVTQVKSTVAGRVVDLKVRKGDTVRKGDVIADVETGDEQAALKVVAFVSSQVGKSISPRDPVQITVAGIRREEYGFLRGTVESVSEYMVSPERVAEVMKEQATKQSSYEVWIVAEVDPKTVSGYAWSNGDGPPERITSGTQATVAIEVDQRAPISQLIPYIKSIFGG